MTTATLESNARVRQSVRTASRVVEGQAVVIVIDSQQLHTLNEVGTFVWNTLGTDTRTVDELVGALTAEFEVERPQAESDVLSFLEELVGLGAVDVLEGA